MKVEYVTNDGLVYEAVFRHFRNAFVEHVRHSLALEFSDSAEAELKAAFTGAEWDRVVSRADEGDVIAGRAESRNDAFDYLDIANFKRIADRFYQFLVPDSRLGKMADANKSILLRWLDDVRNEFRNPVAHPPREITKVIDAIRGVDTVERVLAHLDTMTGRRELEVIMHELLERATRPQEIGSVAPLDDSLPAKESIVTEFVGRSKEMQQLRAWLQLPSRNRWMLVGDGGKGKTATAYTFALEVLEAAPPGLCAVFWLSAKRRKYEIDRVLDIPSPDFANLAECLDQLLRSYGHQSALGMEVDAKRAEVIALLNDLPALIIVDDLDSVTEENEDVIEFLTLDAAQTESKLLFTSRRKFAGLGSTLTVVSGLNEDEGLDFIAKKWGAEGLDQSALRDVDRRRIIKVCEGSPLYMGDLLRLIAAVQARGKSSVRQTIDDWLGVDGEKVRKYALQREMEMLTKPGQSLLEALALAARPATVHELAVLTKMSEDLVLAAIAELNQLYLLVAPALDEDTPQFQINGNLAILVRAELIGTARERSLRALLTSINGASPSVEVTAQTRDLARQARLLMNANRVEEAERLLKRAVQNFPADAHLWALLGYAYLAIVPPRNVDARNAFARAGELKYTERDIYVVWSRLERQLGNYPKAIEVSEMGITNRGRPDPLLLQVAGMAYLQQARAFQGVFLDSKAAEAYKNADKALHQAIAEARRLKLRSVDIQLMYRDWVASARFRDDQKTVCHRLSVWASWRSSDRELDVAIKQHSPFCVKGVHKMA